MESRWYRKHIAHLARLRQVFHGLWRSTMGMSVFFVFCFAVPVISLFVRAGFSSACVKTTLTVSSRLIFPVVWHGDIAQVKALCLLSDCFLILVDPWQSWDHTIVSFWGETINDKQLASSTNNCFDESKLFWTNTAMPSSDPVKTTLAETESIYIHVQSGESTINVLILPAWHISIPWLCYFGCCRFKFAHCGRNKKNFGVWFVIYWSWLKSAMVFWFGESGNLTFRR